MLAFMWIRETWRWIPRIESKRKGGAGFILIIWLKCYIVYFSKPLAIHLWTTISGDGNG